MWGNADAGSNSILPRMSIAQHEGPPPVAGAGIAPMVAGVGAVRIAVGFCVAVDEPSR